VWCSHMATAILCSFLFLMHMQAMCIGNIHILYARAGNVAQSLDLLDPLTVSEPRSTPRTSWMIVVGVDMQVCSDLTPA
jgi:hypothetical protein